MGTVKSFGSVSLTPLDELLGSSDAEQISHLPLSGLHSFVGHPFRVLDDADMEKLTESVRENGVMVPILVRPRKEGGYEIVAGHRRRHACALVGLTEIPAIIRELSDSEAISQMVDTNLQRTKLLPSEKAFAYRMRLDVIKSRSSQVGTRSDAELADEVGESRNQVQRYIRLTYLNHELLEMTDQSRIPVNAAVELSYIVPEIQDILSQEVAFISDTMSDGGILITIQQAKNLRFHVGVLSNEGEIRKEIHAILRGSKPVPRRVTLKSKTLAEYFPADFDEKQMEETILTLLQAWKEGQMG